MPPGANEPLASGEGRAVAGKLAEQLADNFVYADQGKRYAAMLRANAAAGRYDQGTRQDLAERMTGDLMAVQKDGHLRVAVDAQAANQNGQMDERGGPPPGLPPMIQSAKWLAPGIAYIRFTAFSTSDEEVAAVRVFMREHKDANTIIFDLRNHHGGGQAEMDEIFPYLYGKKTALLTMEMPRSVFEREGSPFGNPPTLEFSKDESHVRAMHYAIPGDASPLRDANIYLLVSNNTGSAGEHFALALKATGRAALIGEPTAGANHFGGERPVGEHFTAFIPFGRSYDFRTGKDWEGVGVAPDITVDPTQALIVALEKAGLSHDDAVRIDATEIPAEPVHRDRLRAR